MDCKRCRINGQKKEGGLLGMCIRHEKTKCHICGKLSAGNELCSACTHDEEELRWKNEANLRLTDTDDQQTNLALRKESLLEAKFYAHRAIEVLFRGLLLSIQALWGDIEQKEKIEHKKAA